MSAREDRLAKAFGMLMRTEESNSRRLVEAVRRHLRMKQQSPLGRMQVEGVQYLRPTAEGLRAKITARDLIFVDGQRVLGEPYEFTVSESEAALYKEMMKYE